MKAKHETLSMGACWEKNAVFPTFPPSLHLCVYLSIFSALSSNLMPCNSHILYLSVVLGGCCTNAAIWELDVSTETPPPPSPVMQIAHCKDKGRVEEGRQTIITSSLCTQLTRFAQWMCRQTHLCEWRAHCEEHVPYGRGFVSLQTSYC